MKEKSNERKMFCRNSGITLIVLIITIIILIILSNVAISALVNNGIIGKAKIATQEYKNAQEYEETQIAKLTNEIDKNIINDKNDNLKGTFEVLNIGKFSHTGTRGKGNYYDEFTADIKTLLPKYYNDLTDNNFAFSSFKTYGAGNNHNGTESSDNYLSYDAESGILTIKLNLNNPPSLSCHTMAIDCVVNCYYIKY